MITCDWSSDVCSSDLAVVTPSQDPYTFLAMGIPLYGLYELATLILSLVERRRARKAAKSGA
jgi:sec-independent protein translocase protein TatC